MKVQLRYTWRQAFKPGFNRDRILEKAQRVPEDQGSNEFSVMCGIDHDAHEIREWLQDNDIRNYQMWGVFDKLGKYDIYYSGLAFVFNDDNDAMFFRLRFS